MKNKRLVASITAIVMSSVTAGVIVYLAKLTSDQALELFKYYALLVGGICGAYHTAQSMTDHKKIANNGGQ